MIFHKVGAFSQRNVSDISKTTLAALDLGIVCSWIKFHTRGHNIYFQKTL